MATNGTTDLTGSQGLAESSQTQLAEMKAISADSRAFDIATMQIQAEDKKSQSVTKTAKHAYDGMTA
jgi:hypothetical protein